MTGVFLSETVMLFSTCFCFQALCEAWEKTSLPQMCVYWPKSRKRKSKRFRAVWQQSVNKVSTSPCLRSARVFVQAGMGGFRQAWQLTCKARKPQSGDRGLVLPGGPRGNVQHTEPCERVLWAFAAGSTWPGLGETNSKFKSINQAGSCLQAGLCVICVPILHTLLLNKCSPPVKIPTLISNPCSCFISKWLKCTIWRG